MLPSFAHRANEEEIMDDLRQPEHEFAAAYRELEIINRWLGGVRSRVHRYLISPVAQKQAVFILQPSW